MIDRSLFTPGRLEGLEDQAAGLADPVLREKEPRVYDDVTVRLLCVLATRAFGGLTPRIHLTVTDGKVRYWEAGAPALPWTRGSEYSAEWMRIFINLHSGEDDFPFIVKRMVWYAYRRGGSLRVTKGKFRFLPPS